MKLAKALTQIVVAVASIWSSAAMAKTPSTPCASFTVPRDEISIKYDPFSNSAETKSFNLKTERGSKDVASIRAFLRDASPVGTQPKLGPAGPADYNIIGSDSDSSGAVFGWNSASLPANGGISLQFANSGEGVKNSRLTLSIPAQQPTGTGIQRQPIEVIYACFDSSGREIGSGIQTDNAFEIEIDVKRVFGAFTGSQGITSGEVNFGIIDVTSTVPRTQTAVVTVLSSQTYDMSIASERGFMLRQTDRGPGLPYSATIDNLEIMRAFNMSCPLTVPAGRGHQVNVTLDTREASKLPFGNYSDTLVITFQPRDGSINSRSCQSAAR